MSEYRVEMKVNGRRVAEAVEARTSLGDFLRLTLGYTGVHMGCEHGVCGACTLMVDGRAVRSCLMLAVQAEGCEVLTVEGLADTQDALHPAQDAMRKAHGLQCGFCTPGVVMTLASLCADGRCDEQSMVAAMSGHICRCTGYQGIRRAITMLAAEVGSAGSDT